MEVKTRQFKRVDLVEVGGRVDSAAAPELEEVLQEIMNEGRFRIVVDLQGTEYLGSGGLRVLISALKQVRRWNRGDLRLANLPERVQAVLQLAGMDVLFRSYDSTVDAVGSF
jgi:anti-sigma B factor antagonist